MKENRIKSLMPRKNSQYHQGVVPTKLLTKYAESCKSEPCIFRSGLELQFIQYCESNPKIIKWASEPIAIPYYNRLLDKQQNYYPDYIIESVEGKKCIVEVKPESQTVKPSAIDSAWLKKTWITNVDKWTAAKEFAKKHNMSFVIVTEKTLGN